jgi:hypothetical protein
MRRKCGACGGALRWDESLSVCVIEGEGSYKACPRCVARSAGLPEPAPRVYPAGDDPPLHPYRDDYLPICGMCRTALFEGDRTRRIRLMDEDVEGTDTEAGGYCACRACVEKWKPVVHARLVRDGRFSGPIEALGGNALS